jgi:hypothetical protein
VIWLAVVVGLTVEMFLPERPRARD